MLVIIVKFSYNLEKFKHKNSIKLKIEGSVLVWSRERFLLFLKHVISFSENNKKSDRMARDNFADTESAISPLTNLIGWNPRYWAGWEGIYMSVDTSVKKIGL